MKFRATVVWDMEITEQMAFDRYGVVDAYSIAQVMQRKASDAIVEMRKDLPTVTDVNVKVEPR